MAFQKQTLGGTAVQAWNAADQFLIKNARGATKDCTVPQEAQVCLANRVVKDIDRYESGHLKLSGKAKLKWRVKQFLRSKEIFGNKAAIWTMHKLRQQCESYLIDQAKNQGSSNLISISNDRFSDIRKTGKHWEKVHLIDEKLRDLGPTLILQGSQADQTTTSFSDIDLVLFSDFQDPDVRRLRSELNQIVLTVDPLQHHGVFHYDINSLRRFSESVLPLATFRKSTAISAPAQLEFSILNDRYSPAIMLWSFVQALKTFFREKTIRGLWDWKFKVSQFLLIPTLLAAVRGSYLYKGDSFANIAPLFSDTAWKTIDTLTKVRNNWTYPQGSSGLAYPADDKRAMGSVIEDPWAVDDDLAAWKTKTFRDSATAFLSETLALAGLE